MTWVNNQYRSGNRRSTSTANNRREEQRRVPTQLRKVSLALIDVRVLASTMTRMRACSRGFSLIEVVVAIVLVSVLSVIAVSYFSGAREGAEEVTTLNTLESAAVAQELYRQSRGVFATTEAQFAELSYGDARFVTGASSGPGQVSAQVLPGGDLGLAVSASAARCAVLRLGASGASSSPLVVTLSGGESCSGVLAE